VNDEFDPDEFLSTLGADTRRVTALREAGYETPEDVQFASLDELTAIAGIDRAFARKLKDAVEETDEAEEEMGWRGVGDSWDHGDHGDHGDHI
jgi:hypothetical protein